MDQNLILWADESPSDRNKLKQEVLPSKHLLAASYIHQIWHKSSWWTATEQQSLYAIRLDKNITKGLSFWKFDGLLLICIPGRGLRKRREDWLNWPAIIIIQVASNYGRLSTKDNRKDKRGEATCTLSSDQEQQEVLAGPALMVCFLVLLSLNHVTKVCQNGPGGR